MPVVLVVGTLVSIVYTIVMTGLVNKFHIGKNQARILICIYGAIIAVACYKVAT